MTGLLSIVLGFYAGWLLGAVIFTSVGVWRGRRRTWPRWMLERPGDPPIVTGILWRSIGHGLVVRLKWRGPVEPTESHVDEVVAEAVWTDVKPDRTIH